jgi:hypothetical protein
MDGSPSELWACAPCHRSSGHDRHRAPYDHPDFNRNAFSGFVQRFLEVKGSRVLESAVGMNP